MIIFGWGFKTNKIFGSKNARCQVCNNMGFTYIRTRTWFTLFFIPIFPIGTVWGKYCNICGNGFKMTKERFFAELAEHRPEPQAVFAEYDAPPASNAQPEYDAQSAADYRES
ncbi:MAG: zinc ribbon domain-containing protein [Firmicutes bacterium]|nr:zinc ribbon domain-containing protein [Bacillota bacterium]